MKNNFFSVDDKRMTCVRPSLKTDHHVRFFSQKVDHFSFSFITPLRADHHNVGHQSTIWRTDLMFGTFLSSSTASLGAGVSIFTTERASPFFASNETCIWEMLILR